MRNDRSRKIWLRLAAVLLAVCLPLCAQAAKVVRIGYLDYSGFYSLSPDGQQSGYIYSLMMECAQMTDRQYAFVKVEPENCMKLFASGQIDLLVGAPKTLPCAAELTYGTESVISSPKVLVVLPESPLGYGDYQKLNGKTIAVCYEDTAGQMEELLAEKGVAATVIVLDSHQQMLAALANGEADAAVMETDMGITGLRQIGEVTEQDLYCVLPAGQDTALLQETENAIRDLHSISPVLLPNLHADFLVVDDNAYPALTGEELAYIGEGKEIVVAVLKRDMLNNSQPIPAVGMVLAELSAKTGLRFTYQPWEDEAKAISALKTGKADIMLAFDSDFEWTQHHQVRRTVPYLVDGYRMVHKPDAQQIKKVAVVSDSYVSYCIRRDGGYQLLLFADEKECVQAVLDGQADGALIRSSVAELTLYELDNRELVYDTVDEYGSSLSIAVSRQSSFRLTPLLNKAIGSIRPERFQAIAMPAVGETAVAKLESDARQKIVAVGSTAFAGLLLLGGLALWVWNRLQTSVLQVNARNDYIRSMTSSIRRPMQSLQGVAAGGSRLDRADAQQALGMAGARLSELASETEIMSQLDDQTFTLDPVPVRLSEVLDRLIESVSQRTDVRSIQLEVRRPDKENLIVMLDEACYRYICFVLIENAISRTESGRRMELSFEVERVQEGKDQWVLVTSIGDDGAMMSRQFIRRISEKPRRDSERVLGLRLMTGKKIVDAMGGEMGVHQRPSGGMRFVVHLPVQRAELLHTMSMKSGAYSGDGLLSGVNILAAEENPVTAQLLLSVLSNEGAHVDLVQSGQQLLDRFLASPPAFYQAIITDLKLPEMSGGEASVTIRDLPRRDSSSVFILGMQAGMEAVEPEEDRAMNVILQKPLDFVGLSRKLRSWLYTGGKE